MRGLADDTRSLLDALARTQADFASMDARVSHADAAIRAALDTLSEAVGERSAPPTNDPNVERLRQRAVAAYTTAISAWTDRVRQHVAGTRFIEKFDRSLIVVVYGKVKAGKSSLGNFLAGVSGCADATASVYAPWGPRGFTVHDAAGARGVDRLVEIDNFGVNILEATAGIQTFALGPLTWVDTPGIHSLTEAHQALAREYVAHADLVVYATSSDSPVRASDLRELEELGRARKRVIVVITKSDTTDEDEVDGEIVTRTVPKSQVARGEQTQWVHDELVRAELKCILEDPRIVHVSVRLAVDATRVEDRARYAASGIPQFYGQLAAVIEQRGRALKEAAPIRRLDALLDALLDAPTDSEAALRGVLDSVQRELSVQRNTLRALHPSLVELTMLRVEPELRRVIAEAEAAHARGEPVTDLGARLNAAASEAAAACFHERVSPVVEAFERSRVGLLSGLVGGGVTLEDAFDDVEVPNTERVKGRGRAVGAVVGGGIGFFFGGPLGSAIGGVIGTFAGDFVGQEMFGGTYTRRVKVGTNAQEVSASVLESMKECLPQLLTAQLRAIDDAVFAPHAKQLSQLCARLDALRATLQDLRSTR